MNKNFFFILGLPRSRTSWLANFFTHTNTFCYHEALREVASIEELKTLLENHDEQNIGNSDCAMVPYIDEIVEIFPNAKILVVERKPHEVVESLLDFQLTEEYDKTEQWINRLQKQINYIKKNYQTKSIKHTDLNNIEICKEIWDYLLPNLPFNQKRWKMLDDMYVNIQMTKTFLRTKKDSLHLEFNKF